VGIGNAAADVLEIFDVQGVSGLLASALDMFVASEAQVTPKAETTSKKMSLLIVIIPPVF